MSLLDDICNAQIKVAEDAVCANLNKLGLLDKEDKKMINLIVKHRILTEFGVDVSMPGEEIESNILSFHFKDGENYHFEVKKNATKKELLSCLLGTADLVKKSIIDSHNKPKE